MKILVLTSVYPEPDDGTEIVTPTVKYFCDKWVEQGHEVIVIHNNSCFPLPFYWIPTSITKKMESKLGHNFPVKSARNPLVNRLNGVKVFRLPLKKAMPHGKFSSLKINNQIKKIENILTMEKFVPEVIVSHWVNPQLDLIIKLGERYNAKASLVFHGDCSDRNIEKFNLIENIKKLDAVGCRNETYAKYVAEKLNLKKGPFVCYSGIPDNLAQQQIENIDSLELEDSLSFLYVGRLIKYKNVDVKHIILWQLKDEFSTEEKEAIKAGIKSGLEGLMGQVPGLLEITVHTNGLPSSNADLMLDSAFESEDALKGYAVHLAHVEVADTKVRPYTAMRTCLDFEIS